MNHLQTILQLNDTDLLGDCLVICSEQNVDGSFMLHHFLSLYIKNKANVCLLGVSQTFHNYNSVGKKLGVDYAVSRKEGTFIFIDYLKEGGLCLMNKIGTEVNVVRDSDSNKCTHEASSLNPYLCITGIPHSIAHLYRRIYYQCKQLQQIYPETPLVFVIDSLTLLLSLGVPVNDIAYFIIYLSKDLRKLGKCSIVAMITDDGDEDTSLLTKQLCHVADLVLSTEGLPSGYSKDVHGQLMVQWRNMENLEQGVGSRRKMQYKLTEKHISLFAVGTSSAVL